MHVCCRKLDLKHCPDWEEKNVFGYCMSRIYTLTLQWMNSCFHSSSWVTAL